MKKKAPINVKISWGLWVPVIFILAAILSVVFFYRGNEFTSFSLTLVVPLGVIVCVYIILILKSVINLRVYTGGGIYILFFLLIIVNSLLEGVFGGGKRSLEFIIEIILNWSLLIVFLSFLRGGVITSTHVIKIIILCSLPLSLHIIYKSTTLEAVRRIGSDVETLAAVNHAGHSLAISAIFATYIFIVKIYNNKSLFNSSIYLTVIFINTFALILTMSRGSIVGFLIGESILLMWVLRWAERSTRWAIFLTIVTASGGLLYWVLSSARYGGLASRLAYESLSRGLESRMTVAFSALSSLDSISLLIGQPSRYSPVNDVNPILYPHNVMISILVHCGILPLLLFVWISVSRFVRLYKKIKGKVWEKMENLSILASVMPVITYSFTSGRLTRIMTIFVIISLIEYKINR